MRLFIRMLNKIKPAIELSENKFDNATIVREAGVVGGRIDILIINENESECIIIENKILYAPDQPSQLEKILYKYERAICRAGNRLFNTRWA